MTSDDSTTASPLGRFIVFEGVEGVGKSTQVQALEQWLRTQQIPCITTREPGGTPLGEEIRALVLAMRDQEEISHQAELLLMMAARMQHWYTKIQPTLLEGTWVLCDRFIDSSVAYQGAGRGLDESMIRTFHQQLAPSIRADLIILLDMSIEASLRRVATRGKKQDRMEQSSQDFFERARQCFLDGAALAPQHYSIINAEQTQSHILREIILECQQRFAI